MQPKKQRPALMGSMDTNDNVDYISQLPDDILHYILSFVDIFDVVGLSVLSKRWNYLWTTMPYLEFDIERFYFSRISHVPVDNKLIEKFRSFIDWVLIYQGSNRITRLCLPSGCLFDKVQIQRWIRVAARRNVQELDLRCEPSEGFELPYSLVTCGFLKVLKLNLSCSVLHLPSHVKFSQLRCLTLECVQLTDEDLIRSMLSECTLLENLSLKNCLLRQLTVLDVSSPSLRCMTIKSSFHKKDGDGFCDCEIRISCPNLLRFTYRAALARKYNLHNVSSLETMFIDTYPEYGKLSQQDIGSSICKILKKVMNLRALELRIDAIACLGCATEELQRFCTTFDRLKSLKLWMGIAGHYTRAMYLLLNYCPMLESLTIVIEELFQSESNEHRQLDEEGPTWWKSHLKLVRLINFSGEKSEVDFVKYMLKNGLTLEKFIIIWIDVDEKSKALENAILKLPRASYLLAVNFYDNK